MPSLQKAIDAMVWAAESNQVGYSQSDRTSVWGHFFGSGKYNADCSSLVVGALKHAGFDVGAASWTGNFLEELVPRGWKKVRPDGHPKPGDIILNVKNHVCMCVGNDMVAEACWDEHQRATGGKRGDQTGQEVVVRPYYVPRRYKWDWYLRWTGASDAGSTPSKPAAKAPAQPEYRAFFNGRWQTWMSNYKQAGASGSKMMDFEARKLGPRGWYQLTLMDGTLLPKNRRNVDRKQAIRGITVYYDTDTSKTGGAYYEAQYRVRPYGRQWLRVEHDDDGGGAGDDKHAVCCIQLKIARCR